MYIYIYDNIYIYIYIYFIIIFYLVESFHPSMNVDEVFTYNHMVLISLRKRYHMPLISH